MVFKWRSCLLIRSRINILLVSSSIGLNMHDLTLMLENESPGNLLRKAMSLNSSASTEQDKEKSSHSTNTPKSRIIITRNPRKSSPNITLNSHNITSRAELRIAAVWGVVLQLGLIAYAGCSVHYPSLGFLKDGEPVAQYAFPCHWVGTLLLVVGLLLCGHVVESSTIEEEFRPSHELTAQLVWLQQTKTVSDQVFDSFAIYAKTKRSFITTSERRRGERKPPGPHLNQVVMPDIAPVNEKPGISLELEASIGTVVSLCGYIVQFCGLRGLHWSVSIAQLGAILLMTAVRAWVRRGLADPPRSLQTRPGYELDWFATTFADIPNSPWIPGAKYKTQAWSIKSLQAQVNEFEEDVPQESSTVSTEHRVVMIRRDLAQLTSWQGPASAEAVSLARSVETTMNTLFRYSELSNFTCSLAAHGEVIYFRLNPLEGKWNAHADELEAALSMWLFSVDELEKNEEINHQDIVGDKKDDKLLRVKGSPSRPGLRVLGSYTESLHRDLSWWMPSETARIKRLSRLTNLPERGITTDATCKENYRVVGLGGSEIDRRQFGVEELPEFTVNMERRKDDKMDVSEFYWFSSIYERRGEEKTQKTSPGIEGNNSSHDVLVAEFHGPLKLLYAQDIFSSYFRAAVMTLKQPLEGPVETRPKHEAKADTNWKSFALHNDQLLKLAKNIEDTGLGNLSDVYLSIIPALSVENKLPGVSLIVDLAAENARYHERQQHWQQAGAVYLWLFRVAMTFSVENELSTLATVRIVDFLRQVSLALNLSGEQIQFNGRHHYALYSMRAMCFLKRDLENEIRSALHGPLEVASTVLAILKLYEDQKRPWQCNLVEDSTLVSGNNSGYSKSTYRYHEKCRHTDLNETIWTGDYARFTNAIRRREDVNAKYILGWTPLHYGIH